MKLLLSIVGRNFLLVVPAIGAILVFIVVFFLLRRQSRPISSIRTNGTRDPHSKPSSDRNYVAAYSGSIETPLFLLLGPPNSGQSSILDALKEVFPERARRMRSGIGYFDGGVVLECDGGIFVSTANGAGNPDRWKKFVDRLQKRRPQRPIDGVILTVSCHELVGESALSADQWQQRAAQMSKNLLVMRDRFGFCFPVYVVVTKCHGIRAFQEFSAGQLRGHWREIFGWSNPYNLDTSFHPMWTEHAFTYMRRVLEEQRSYFFARQNSANGHSPKFRDELFLFPTKFQQLEKPIACFLENLFHDSGHRDALEFRGLYFSGHGRTTHDDFAEEHDHLENGHLAEFTAELFDQKIFLERGLARPVDVTLTPRNRKVSVARTLCWVAAIVLFAGTALAWRTLSSKQEKVLPHIKRMKSALRKPAEMPQAEPAYDAVYTAQALSGRNFQAYFLPLSVIDSLDSKAPMQNIFGALVYPGLHEELKRRTQELVQDECVWGACQSTRPAPLQLSVLQSAEASQRLAGFVNDLISLEDNIILFNGAADSKASFESRNGKSMLALVSNLAPDFFADVPRRSLSAMDPIVRGSQGDHYIFDGSEWNDATINRLETMVTGVLGQRLNEEKLRRTLYASGDQINLLEANKLDTYQQLDDLHTSLAQLQTQLAAPDLEWIAKNEFQLPPDLNSALAPLFARTPEQNVLLCGSRKESHLCTGLQELDVFVKRAVRGHFSDFRAELLAAKSNTTGNLIAVSDGKLELSPSATRLQTVLDGFLKLPFVARQGAGRIRDVQFCGQLTWNSTKLQEALQDKAAYDKFFNDLANSQDTFQDTLQAVALDRLENNMVDAIAGAEELHTLSDCESNLQDTSAEARNFAAVAQPLVQLLGDFSELNFDDDYQDLKRVSTQHALAVLSRLDRYFEHSNFYWPANRDFNSWTGKSPLSTTSYNAHGPDDMLAYLSLQRQGLQPYIASAKPLVKFLQEQSPAIQKQSTLIAKWLGIINDVEKFPNSPTSSSLGSLEDYLATELDKTVPPDCQTPVTPPATVYFAETQRSIELAISARCRFLSQHRGIMQYTDLADFFNQHLKGKFPFCKPSAEDAAEADPGDVIELFRLLDADSKAIHQAVQSNASANSYTTSTMATFVNQLDSLRPLFGSLLSGEMEKAPAWDFVPAFRVNRNHEFYGNQIIDWTFSAGNDSFHNFDAPKTGHWSFGQPVALTLRWAKNSPTRPIAPAQAYSDPATKAVIFEYKDPWSLLRMLVKHAAPSDDFDRKVDPDPQTLAFTIPQQVIPENGAKGQQFALLPANQTAGPDVKVFIRITLFSPGKTTSLRLPLFPTEAPTP